MTEADRKLFKEYYEEWNEKTEARKNLNKEMSEDIKRAADLTDYEAKTIKKVFMLMKKKEADGNDELDELNEIFAELEV